MPPRYVYWTILIDGKATAFRAREKEELLPTLKQLERTNERIELKFFARGKLWDSPEQAEWASSSMTPPRERRTRDWRPGGTHRDPRQRFERPTKKEPTAASLRERDHERTDRPEGADDAEDPKALVAGAGNRERRSWKHPESKDRKAPQWTPRQEPAENDAPPDSFDDSHERERREARAPERRNDRPKWKRPDERRGDRPKWTPREDRGQKRAPGGGGDRPWQGRDNRERNRDREQGQSDFRGGKPFGGDRAKGGDNRGPFTKDRPQSGGDRPKFRDDRPRSGSDRPKWAPRDAPSGKPASGRDGRPEWKPARDRSPQRPQWNRSDDRGGSRPGGGKPKWPRPDARGEGRPGGDRPKGPRPDGRRDRADWKRPDNRDGGRAPWTPRDRPPRDPREGDRRERPAGEGRAPRAPKGDWRKDNWSRGDRPKQDRPQGDRPPGNRSERPKWTPRGTPGDRPKPRKPR